MENVQRSATITVATSINAPIEKVWKIFTEPEHITKWCQASPDWHAPEASNDLRVGGRFNTVMAAKDGSMQFNFNGEYIDVKEYERIEYNIADGRNVKVNFTVEGGVVRVTEQFEPESINPTDIQQAGWQAIMDSFKTYVEAQ